MLIRILAIVAMTEAYRLCSCCYDPSIYRGVEINGDSCVQVKKPFPLGINDTDNYSVTNEEDLNLVTEFLLDYVFYPPYLPTRIVLNDTIAWYTKDKRLQTINDSLVTNLYSTGKYTTYIEDKKNYMHTVCCS